MNDPNSNDIRVDLHLHTRASRDCLSDPNKLLARAEEKGIHRIALTDHNRLGLALEMHQEEPDRIIPGEEVRTGEGIDLIGLYLSREIPKGTPAREACQLIREDGGIVYLPHQFARGKGGSGRYAEELAPLVDVVEVFNARLHPGKLNRPAEDLAETLPLRVARHRNHAPAILAAAAVAAVGRFAERAVGELLRLPPGGQRLQHEVAYSRHRGLELREVDVLALPRPRAVLEGAHNGDHSVQGGDRVGIRVLRDGALALRKA